MLELKDFLTTAQVNKCAKLGLFTPQDVVDHGHRIKGISDVKMRRLTSAVYQARETVIVSRHEATIEWLLERYPDCRIIRGNATTQDVKGRHVIGNIPFSLAVEAASVTAVEFDSPPRGVELDLEYVRFNARLARYVVRRGE